jgi:hypothetical protein
MVAQAMSEITMRGTRTNVIGLLRLMADEIESGERRSATAFSAHPGDDPTHTFVVQVDEVSRTDTTMTVRA